jgi:two-component system, NarL family, nitrate/nitrite response regulator NarL
MNTIRVAIVDDHPIFRDGVIHALRAAPDINVVGVGGSAADAIAIGRELKPDVLVLDMDMPGGGTAAVDALASEVPAVRVLMLTVVANEERVCEAIQKGARGYLLKGVGGAELVHAVRLVHAGECYVTPTLATHLMAHLGKASNGTNLSDRLAVLSVREGEVVSLIAQGCSNKEIAIKLELSEKTVKHYVTSLLQKLGVRNRVAAALIAVRGTSQAGRAGCASDHRTLVE